MSVPDYQTLMLPLLDVLKDGQEKRIATCLPAIAKNLKLTEADIDALLPSGRQTVFENRVRWAKRYMEKAGLLEVPARGIFKITSRGRDILNRNPSRIDNKLLSEFPEFVAWHKRFERDEQSEQIIHMPDEQGSLDETIQKSFVLLSNELVTEILDMLYSEAVTYQMFERIIVDLLIAMGYGGGKAEMGRAIGKSGDSGVDGVIKEDALGLDVVYIQAKKYKADSGIGRPEIQSFVGSLEGMNAAKGVFVTTSYFTSQAKEYALKVHKRIVLIDGNELARLMIRHNVGVRIKELFEIKMLDENYYTE